jgi:hypothetical protein
MRLNPLFVNEYIVLMANAGKIMEKLLAALAKLAVAFNSKQRQK